MHWLSVRRRVEFKIATLIFKTLAPSHLSEECQPVADTSRRLWSSDTVNCVVPWTKTRMSDKSFTVVGPRVCNMLPLPALLRLVKIRALCVCWRYTCLTEASACRHYSFLDVYYLLTYLLTVVHKILCSLLWNRFLRLQRQRRLKNSFTRTDMATWWYACFLVVKFPPRAVFVNSICVHVVHHANVGNNYAQAHAVRIKPPYCVHCNAEICDQTAIFCADVVSVSVTTLLYFFV